MVIVSKLITFAPKLPDKTIERVKRFCKKRGLKISTFIGKAIEEKIEKEELIEDSEDILKLRHEEPSAVPLKKYFEKKNIKS